MLNTFRSFSSTTNISFGRILRVKLNKRSHLTSWKWMASGDPVAAMRISEVPLDWRAVIVQGLLYDLFLKRYSLWREPWVSPRIIFNSSFCVGTALPLAIIPLILTSKRGLLRPRIRTSWVMSSVSLGVWVVLYSNKSTWASDFMENVELSTAVKTENLE